VGGKLIRDELTKELDASLLANIEKSCHQGDTKKEKMGKMVDTFLMDSKTPVKSKKNKRTKKNFKDKHSYHTQMKDDGDKKNKFRSYRMEQNS